MMDLKKSSEQMWCRERVMVLGSEKTGFPLKKKKQVIENQQISTVLNQWLFHEYLFRKVLLQSAKLNKKGYRIVLLKEKSLQDFSCPKFWTVCYQRVMHHHLFIKISSCILGKGERNVQAFAQDGSVSCLWDEQKRKTCIWKKTQRYIA